MRLSPLRAAGGLAVLLVLSLAAASLSQAPAWQSLPEDHGMLRISLRQGGKRTCRIPDADELARLPPNMRTREICDRHRPPVGVRVVLDGRTVFDEDVPPSGLWGTGPSRLYLKLPVPAGAHVIALDLRDDPSNPDGGWHLEREITISPGENVAIDFSAEAGGFIVIEGSEADG